MNTDCNRSASNYTSSYTDRDLNQLHPYIRQKPTEYIYSNSAREHPDPSESLIIITSGEQSNSKIKHFDSLQAFNEP